MAIIENRATEIGDVIRIKTEVPVVGLLFLTTFSDDTDGEGSAYFSKQFRYSNDAGLNFTAWNDLTVINIQNVMVERKDQFILEYRYEAVGSGIGSGLVFNSITVSGDFENLEYPIYDTTLFKKFFDVNDIAVLRWALNVLEKLYRSGILPEYITRGEDVSDNTEDKDFITFWHSTTHFFALIVYFYRQYENIQSNKELIKEFLGGKDIALPIDENLEELSYLLYNYIGEYRKRGTERIVYQKGENGELIDGELLRTIGYQVIDEFMFALLAPKDTGLCIGHSSPNWKGTEGIINLIKAYEPDYGFKDTANYPLMGDTYITLDSNKKLALSNAGTSISAGIGMSTVDRTKLIKVDAGIDYVVTADVTKTDELNDNLRFDCIAYDEDYNAVDLMPLSEQNTTFVNSFIGGTASFPIFTFDVLESGINFSTASKAIQMGLYYGTRNNGHTAVKEDNAIKIANSSTVTLSLKPAFNYTFSLFDIDFGRVSGLPAFTASNYMNYSMRLRFKNFSDSDVIFDSTKCKVYIYILYLDAGMSGYRVFETKELKSSLKLPDGSYNIPFAQPLIEQFPNDNVTRIGVDVLVRPFNGYAPLNYQILSGQGVDIELFKINEYENQSDWGGSGGLPTSILHKSNIKFRLNGVLKGSQTKEATMPLTFLMGRALKMPESVKYINPRIYTTGSAGANITISNFKVRPASLPFSRGQLGIKNIIVSYLKNRSGETINTIKDFIVSKLLPYKSFFKIKEL